MRCVGGDQANALALEGCRYDHMGWRKTTILKTIVYEHRSSTFCAMDGASWHPC